MLGDVGDLLAGGLGGRADLDGRVQLTQGRLQQVGLLLADRLSTRVGDRGGFGHGVDVGLTRLDPGVEIEAGELEAAENLADPRRRICRTGRSG